MKKIFLMLLTGMALASCSEISTDPAPARTTKTQTVSLNYVLSAAPSGTSTDTALVNPRVTVYVVSPVALGDGSVSYPVTTTSTAVQTLTPTTTVQTATLPAVVVADGQPAPVVRLVFSSDNLPGRRSAAQRITTTLFVNNTSTVRATTTYTGLDFPRRTATPAPVAPFRKQTDLAVAPY